MMPTSTLRGRILAAAAQHPARTRAEGRRRATRLFALAAIAAGAPLFLRRELSLDDFLVAAGALGVATSSAVVAFGRGSMLLGRSRAALAAVVLVVPLARLVWLLVAPSGDGASNDALCFARTLFASLPIFAAALVVKKRSVIDHPFATGAAIGIAAASFGATVVDVSCARAGELHVALGHVVPLFVFALIGAWAGMLLRIEPRPR